MLDTRLVEFLRSKNWWYDEESSSYGEALKKLGINKESEFGIFLLHAEDGPDFSWKSDTFHQLCWHVLNTDYLQLHADRRNIFGLPGSFIQFSSLEGGGAYFYDPDSGSIYLAQLGKDSSASNLSNVSKKWKSFNEFALDFFGINQAADPA